MQHGNVIDMAQRLPEPFCQDTDPKRRGIGPHIPNGVDGEGENTALAVQGEFCCAGLATPIGIGQEGFRAAGNPTYWTT